MFSKDKIPFWIMITLFLGMLIYLGIFYSRWGDRVDPEANAVEVNLPIIDWQTYSSLSKQYGDVTLEQ